MSNAPTGLIETIAAIVLGILTYVFTPKTRKKLKEKILSPVKELAPLAVIKMQILTALGGNPSIAAMVFGQFMHETANGTSRIFQNNNNMFGMKHPKSRPTLSVDSVQGYAAFGSHSDSIEDLLMWFENQHIPIHKIGNIEAYVQLLKSKGYFEDTYENYLNGVKAGAQKFFEV